MEKNKKELPGLEHQQYEHSFDKKALSTLECTPGLTMAGKLISQQVTERICTIQFTGSNVKVTRTNYPRVYEYMGYACQILDVKKKPDLYVQWGYGVNAFTVGSEHPIVVINSGLIDLCDDNEIMFIIGHELGHIKSNHMLYHMMAQTINSVIETIPGGNLVAAPLKYALLYWDRMSEFTADRAGLLCCQDKEAMIRAFVKMAGLPIHYFDHVDTASFIQQAAEFRKLDYDSLNKAFKFISIMDSTHPWTVMRAAELLNWMDCGDYDRVFDNINFKQFKLSRNGNKLLK